MRRIVVWKSGLSNNLVTSKGNLELDLWSYEIETGQESVLVEVSDDCASNGEIDCVICGFNYPNF